MRRVRRRRSAIAFEGCLDSLAGPTQGVHPQIEGRAPRKRPQFRDKVVTEGGFEFRQDEGGRIARDLRRGAIERSSLDSATLVRIEGSGRVAFAREQAAMEGAASPCCSRREPITMARGVSAPMIQAAEARRRKAS